MIIRLINNTNTIICQETEIISPFTPDVVLFSERVFKHMYIDGDTHVYHETYGYDLDKRAAIIHYK